MALFFYVDECFLSNLSHVCIFTIFSNLDAFSILYCRRLRRVVFIFFIILYDWVELGSVFLARAQIQILAPAQDCGQELAKLIIFLHKSLA